MNLRMIILETLLLAEKEDVPAGRMIKQVLDKYAYLNKQERSFLKRILEGCVERRIELDHITDSKSKVKTSDMKPVIRQIMRLSVYQLKYMDSIPASAVCNEAVKLAAAKGMHGLKGFVNGVLRSIARDIDNIEYPDPDTLKGISVRYSCPEWLVGQLTEEQGIEKTKAILENSLEKRDICIRTNLSEISADGLSERLTEEGIKHERAPYLPYAFVLKEVDSVGTVGAFKEGLFAVQDIGSMLVTHVAGIKEGDTVMDVCAAPGGKSMHALDILNGSGHVFSFDVSLSKLSLIEENAKRAGHENIDVIMADATGYHEEYKEKADVLIADLPCSGLGVMGRKNDIKYNLSPEKQESLVRLQRRILENVSRYIRPGGRLIFSTCTIHRAENEDNVSWILDNLPFRAAPFNELLPGELKCETAEHGCIQLIPGINDTDGFFISAFVKE